jgi:hypothetical protein
MFALALVATGIIAGILAGTIGIGGGTFCNTVMTLYGRPIHPGGGDIIGPWRADLDTRRNWIYVVRPGAGPPAPLSIGYVNVLGVLLVIPISTLVAPLAVRLAHALKWRQLEIGFDIFLLIVATRFGYSLLKDDKARCSSPFAMTPGAIRQVRRTKRFCRSAAC